MALVAGDDDDGAVAERVGDEGQADAGVARCALDDGQGSAVLDRAAEVEEVSLAVNVAAGALAGLAQTDQGRVADGVEEAVADIHGAASREKNQGLET